ncbi:MAG: lipopolysaccharide biosynthesis protein [Limisphaerales bacterium]
MRVPSLQLKLTASKRAQLVFALGTWMRPFVGVLGGIVTIHYLSPTQVGILNTAALAPPFLAFLQLGVISGVNRDLPFLRGSGNERGADALQENAIAAANLIAVAGFLLCAVIAAAAWFTSDTPSLALALACTCILVGAAPISLLVDSILRGRQRFADLGPLLIAHNVANIAALVLIPFLGFLGGVLRPAVDGLAGIVLRLRKVRWVFRLNPDKAACVSLARSGFPLMVSASLFGLLAVSDRTVVAFLRSPAEVGQLALATVLVNGLSTLPQSLSLLLFPRIAKDYGAHRDPSRLRRYVWLSLAANLAMLIPGSLLGWLLLEWVVPTYFPAYSPGLPAARVACAAGCLWVYIGVGSVLGVLQRMPWYLASMALSLGIVWALGAFALKSGWGIDSAVWARAAGTTLHGAFTVAYALFVTRAAPGAPAPVAASK